MLMLCLSALFSIFSTIMMSYLAMTTELGSWIAPMFAVVCVVLMMPFFDAPWFKRGAVIMIIVSSVGGMIGICLGSSFPAFYFLQQTMFAQWQINWWQLVGIVSTFVLCAGFSAFAVSYIIKDTILSRPTALFPMAQLVNKVLFVQNQAFTQGLIIVGLMLAGTWNFMMYMMYSVVTVFLSQATMLPMLVSVGFVAGITIAPAVLIGLATRVLVLDLMHEYLGAVGSVQMFLVTFALGMMIAWFLQFVTKMLVLDVLKKIVSLKFWTHDLHTLPLYIVMLVLFGSTMLLLSVWTVPILAQWYVVGILLMLAWYVALIIAEIGVIEIDNYVLFVLLPLAYLTTISTTPSLAIVVFATLFLGLVVNALFSYKLAALAKVPFKIIFDYQIVACAISAFTAGFFFLWYSKSCNMGSLDLFFQKAQSLNAIILYGQYDYRIVIAGFLYGLLMQVFVREILVVIGAVIMDPAISCVLVVSGAFAYLVKNRERYYPLWFGVYVGHSLCLMLKAFL